MKTTILMVAIALLMQSVAMAETKSAYWPAEAMMGDGNGCKIKVEHTAGHSYSAIECGEGAEAFFVGLAGVESLSGYKKDPVTFEIQASSPLGKPFDYISVHFSVKCAPQGYYHVVPNSPEKEVLLTFSGENVLAVGKSEPVTPEGYCFEREDLIWGARIEGKGKSGVLILGVKMEYETGKSKEGRQ